MNANTVLYAPIEQNNKKQQMEKYRSIKKLERHLEGHSYTSFEVGTEISEIKDMTNESEQGHINREYEIHYRNGVIVELIGGLFTVTRNAAL